MKESPLTDDKTKGVTVTKQKKYLKSLVWIDSKGNSLTSVETGGLKKKN